MIFRKMAEAEVEKVLDLAGKKVENPAIRKLLVDMYMEAHREGARFGMDLVITGVATIFVTVSNRVEAAHRVAIAHTQAFVTERLQDLQDRVFRLLRDDPEAVDDLVKETLGKVRPESKT